MLAFSIALSSLALSSGCQGTLGTEDAGKLPSMTTPEEIYQVAKAELNKCVVAFYSNKWDDAAFKASQIEEIGRRWQDIPAPTTREVIYREHTKGFAEAAVELKNATRTKDSAATETALHKLFTHVAALDPAK